jgi:hypothetical protein
MVSVSGAFAHLDLTRASSLQRTEGGAGALMPWADRPWMVGYLASPELACAASIG